MKTKLAALGGAVVLVLGVAGVANATPNFVRNGDFSSISTATGVDPNTPSQLNYTPPGTWQHWFPANYGEFVNDWTTTGPLFGQNVVWMPSATAASTVNAEAFDANIVIPLLPAISGPRPLLPASVTAPPAGGPAFIAIQSNFFNLQGQPTDGIQQTISGLTEGQSYRLSFDWAASMDNIDSGTETSSLIASIYGKRFTTGSKSASSISTGLTTHTPPTFSGWSTESFNFIAGAGSSTLQFLASGSPAGLPPYALLTGISINAVPEPSELGIFGLGLLALGVLTVMARRRSSRTSGGQVC